MDIVWLMELNMFIPHHGINALSIKCQQEFSGHYGRLEYRFIIVSQTNAHQIFHVVSSEAIRMDFELTEQHIKLLRKMCVGWQDCETGAPEIDPKRPYGNSYVVGDVREILGISVKRCPHCEEPLDEEEDGGADERAMALHRETEKALMVLLKYGEINPGTYTVKY